jgi:hypothetical protein
MVYIVTYLYLTQNGTIFNLSRKWEVKNAYWNPHSNQKELKWNIKNHSSHISNYTQCIQTKHKLKGRDCQTSFKKSRSNNMCSIRYSL